MSFTSNLIIESDKYYFAVKGQSYEILILSGLKLIKKTPIFHFIVNFIVLHVLIIVEVYFKF